MTTFLVPDRQSSGGTEDPKEEPDFALNECNGDFSPTALNVKPKPPRGSPAFWFWSSIIMRSGASKACRGMFRLTPQTLTETFIDSRQQIRAHAGLNNDLGAQLIGSLDVVSIGLHG
jgi:hypothetical protein